MCVSGQTSPGLHGTLGIGRKMTTHFAKSRQQPLGPDEPFDQLLVRLLRTNRAEREQRERASRIGPLVQHHEQHDSASPPIPA